MIEDNSGNTAAMQWPETSVFTADYECDSLSDVAEVCHGADIEAI